MSRWGGSLYGDIQGTMGNGHMPSPLLDRMTDATENIYLSATSLAAGNKLSAMEHTSKCLFTWHSTFQAKVKQFRSTFLIFPDLFPSAQNHKLYIVKLNFTQIYVEKHCFYACFMT